MVGKDVIALQIQCELYPFDEYPNVYIHMNLNGVKYRATTFGLNGNDDANMQRWIIEILAYIKETLVSGEFPPELGIDGAWYKFKLGNGWLWLKRVER